MNHLLETQSKILIVDDEIELCELIQSIISGCGAEVVIETSAEEALMLTKQHTFQLIICDIMMPRMNGIELLTHLRATGNDYPVIFITGSDTHENLAHALRLGATDFISKPFEPRELVEKVSRCLEIGNRMFKIHEALSSEEKNKIEKEKKMIGLIKVANAKTENIKIKK